MFRILFFCFVSSSILYGQISESTQDTTGIKPVTPEIQVNTISQPIVQAEPVAPIVETTAVQNDSLLNAGIEKKQGGTALTVLGGIFIGSSMIYTILFLTDNDKFGIPLGGSSNGFVEYKFYLNPGIFGLPVGIPCLISGIIGSIKGKNMIEEAKRGKAEASIQPYLFYSMNKEYGAGMVVRF